MQGKHSRLHVGLRTIKTTAAVVISMLIVEALGTTDSRLIFAMLGAMTAVQPTFKESVESSLSQIIGLVFGALVGILLRILLLPPLIATGIGIVLVITLYNVLRIRYSPGLPCFIVVLLCTTPDIQPLLYAGGRIWDTAIGLIVGMVINMLVFPYDNSRQIRATAESLEREVILFLEDMFDGDDQLPNADEMNKKIDALNRQLKIFSNQKLLLRLRRQKEELSHFRICEQKARELVAQMEVLHAMGIPGNLNADNRRILLDCGARINSEATTVSLQEADIITNYHVANILALRSELLKALSADSSEGD